MTLLKNGSRGEDVKVLQIKLNAYGNFGLAADGIFGAKTEAAVRQFQKENNLSVDGIVGPKTWEAFGYSTGINKPQIKDKMKILIDNGHGENTPGKRSPDGKFREYKYTREIATEVVKQLRSLGYDADLLVPETTDISLTQRCKRVNDWCTKLGSKNVCMVSIHINAAGSGTWKTAGGWAVYTSPGQTQADYLATDLYNAAEVALKPYKDMFSTLQNQGHYDSKQKPMRADWSDGDPDYEAKFTMLTGTKCPAALTESLFQDNKKDVEFLESPVGRNAIISLHVNGIKKYVDTYSGK